MLLLIDEILQAFEANGNLHLVLGVSSGQVNEKGRDIKDPVVTLVIPSIRASAIASDFQTAIETLLKDQPAPSAQKDNNSNFVDETLGSGVRVPMS